MQILLFSISLILLGRNKKKKHEKNDWKDRLNVVYSTNPDFGYEMDNDEEQVTLDKDKQNLRVSIDKKNRGGKSGNINYRICRYGERLEGTGQAAEK